MKTLCAVLILSALSFADSFSSLSVMQGSQFVSLSQTSTPTLKLSIGPSLRVLGYPQGYMLFQMPLDSATGVFTSTFTINWTWPSGFTGPWTTTLMSYMDSTTCQSPCSSLVFIAIPKFTGIKSGSIQFSFNGQQSGVYNFDIMRPIPEPGTLAMFGSGLSLLAAFRLRLFNRFFS